MVCGQLGASIESMVTTFSAARDASVMRKGPRKSDFRAVELVMGLVDHRYWDDQLVIIFDLAI
uniref:Uncharacterized protein n=1 Tax=Romanomermis culicivorax TaxID=13658 RepID=A0A915K8Z9_ROMCU